MGLGKKQQFPEEKPPSLEGLAYGHPFYAYFAILSFWEQNSGQWDSGCFKRGGVAGPRQRRLAEVGTHGPGALPIGHSCHHTEAG